MEHELRAEYPAGVKPGQGPILIWHMVRGNSCTAMCGRLLSDEAETRPEEEWSTTGADPIFCHTCGAMWLREVP